MVHTIFKFENIHQSLIVYLFIHAFFYECHIVVKQTLSRKYRILFWIWIVK